MLMILLLQASSFRSLMTALSLSGLRGGGPGGWVQSQPSEVLLGTVWHELLEWVSTNCEEFHEMKIVKYAKICWHYDLT